MFIPINLDEKPELIGARQFTHKGRPESFFKNFWTIHLYSYHGWLDFRGERFEVRPGHMSIISGLENYSFTFEGPSTHYYAHFFPAPVEKLSKTVRLRVMRPLGAFYPGIYEKMARMGQLFPVNHRFAEVFLWEILWELAEMDRHHESPTHQALDRAVCYIEQHLHEPLSVAEVVGETCVSYNTLLKLFRGQTQKSIAAYICDRRMERARNLLIHTTLPVKAIAVDCGIPDLNHFNKTVRRAFGVSPRAFRKNDKSLLKK